MATLRTRLTVAYGFALIGGLIVFAVALCTRARRQRHRRARPHRDRRRATACCEPLRAWVLNDHPLLEEQTPRTPRTARDRSREASCPSSGACPGYFIVYDRDGRQLYTLDRAAAAHARGSLGDPRRPRSSCSPTGRARSSPSPIRCSTASMLLVARRDSDAAPRDHARRGRRAHHRRRARRRRPASARCSSCCPLILIALHRRRRTSSPAARSSRSSELINEVEAITDGRSLHRRLARRSRQRRAVAAGQHAERDDRAPRDVVRRAAPLHRRRVARAEDAAHRAARRRRARDASRRAGQRGDAGARGGAAGDGANVRPRRQPAHARPRRRGTLRPLPRAGRPRPPRARRVRDRDDPRRGVRASPCRMSVLEEGHGGWRRAPPASALPQPRHQRHQVHAERRTRRALAEPARRATRSPSPCATPASACPRPISLTCSSASGAPIGRARARASGAASASASRSASGSPRRTAGRIAVQSRLGRGSVFTVTLPLLDDVARPAASAQRALREAREARDMRDAATGPLRSPTLDRRSAKRAQRRNP